MDIERHYLAALDLTHQMLNAANNQEWDSLVELEKMRAATIHEAPSTATISPLRNPTLARRITEIITEIERESAEIAEQVEVWQKHVRILLRLNKPALA